MKTFFTVLAVLLLSFQPAKAADYPPLKTSEDLLAACPWYVNSFPSLFYNLSDYRYRFFFKTHKIWYGCAVQKLIEKNKISNKEIDLAASRLLSMPDLSWSFYFWTYLLEERFDPRGAFRMANILALGSGVPQNIERAKHLSRVSLLTTYDSICLQKSSKTWERFYDTESYEHTSHTYEDQKVWYLSLCKKSNKEILDIAQKYSLHNYKYRNPLIAYILLRHLAEKRSYKPAEKIYKQIQREIKQKG